MIIIIFTLFLDKKEMLSQLLKYIPLNMRCLQVGG